MYVLLLVFQVFGAVGGPPTSTVHECSHNDTESVVGRPVLLIFLYVPILGL